MRYDPPPPEHHLVLKIILLFIKVSISNKVNNITTNRVSLWELWQPWMILIMFHVRSDTILCTKQISILPIIETTTGLRSDGCFILHFAYRVNESAAFHLTFLVTANLIYHDQWWLFSESASFLKRINYLILVMFQKRFSDSAKYVEQNFRFFTKQIYHHITDTHFVYSFWSVS